MISKKEYYKKLGGMTRKELLQACRWWGITAHKCQADHQLKAVLWKAYTRSVAVNY